MNIFVLDIDPSKAAQQHNDKHVVKMVLETAQLLSSAVRHYNANLEDELIYKTTHKNHPCAVWCRKTKHNFLWLYDLGIELSKEYTHRYSKIHKSQAVIKHTVRYIDTIPDGVLTKFAQAMPDVYKNKNPVTAYRNYYRGEKSGMLTYTKRLPPVWLVDMATAK